MLFSNLLFLVNYLHFSMRKKIYFPQLTQKYCLQSIVLSKQIHGGSACSIPYVFMIQHSLSTLLCPLAALYFFLYIDLLSGLVRGLYHLLYSFTDHFLMVSLSLLLYPGGIFFFLVHIPRRHWNPRN